MKTFLPRAHTLLVVKNKLKTTLSQNEQCVLFMYYLHTCVCGQVINIVVDIREYELRAAVT